MDVSRCQRLNDRCYRSKDTSQFVSVWRKVFQNHVSCASPLEEGHLPALGSTVSSFSTRQRLVICGIEMSKGKPDILPASGQAAVSVRITRRYILKIASTGSMWDFVARQWRQPMHLCTTTDRGYQPAGTVSASHGSKYSAPAMMPKCGCFRTRAAVDDRYPDCE